MNAATAQLAGPWTVPGMRHLRLRPLRRPTGHDTGNAPATDTVATTEPRPVPATVERSARTDAAASPVVTNGVPAVERACRTLAVVPSPWGGVTRWRCTTAGCGELFTDPAAAAAHTR